MKVGEYTQIVATVSPQPCESALTFLVPDNEVEEGIVNVIGDGVIKALKPGKTTVTVALNDLAEECIIFVTYDENPTEPATIAPTIAPTAANSTKSGTTGSAVQTSSGAVKTGQNSIVMILLLLSATALGIFIYNKYRRKHNRNS